MTDADGNPPGSGVDPQLEQPLEHPPPLHDAMTRKERTTKRLRNPKRSMDPPKRSLFCPAILQLHGSLPLAVEPTLKTPVRAPPGRENESRDADATRLISPTVGYGRLALGGARAVVDLDGGGRERRGQPVAVLAAAGAGRAGTVVALEDDLAVRVASAMQPVGRDLRARGAREEDAQALPTEDRYGDLVGLFERDEATERAGRLPLGAVLPEVDALGVHRGVVQASDAVAVGRDGDVLERRVRDGEDDEVVDVALDEDPDVELRD